MSDVIAQMQKTKADICLFNFSIIYENEEQKANSLGLVKEKEKMAKILKAILSSPGQSIEPIQLPNLLEVTSLGWTKCYAPTVNLPEPAACAFEDFVYMASLLEAQTITALPAENESVRYRRRSSSICGQRKSKNFTDDIPTQLMKSFDTVLKQNKDIKEQLQKIKMAQDFVNRKLDQYLQTLSKIVETKSHQDIDYKTLEIYREKATMIKDYMDKTIKSLT